AQQRLRFAELTRERAVERARRLELLLELLRRLAELLHAVGHLPLFLRERAGLLRVLVAHPALRLRLLASTRRRALRALRAAVARLRARRFVRALRERLLRGRCGARLLRRRIAELTRADAAL